MSKTVVLVGALDTKGVEFSHVRRLIEDHGLTTVVVDFGVMGPPAFEPDVTRDEVMAAAGGDPGRLASGEHKDEAMRKQATRVLQVIDHMRNAVIRQ